MNAERGSTVSHFCPARHKAQPLLRTIWELLPKVSQAEGSLHIFFSDSKRKAVESRGTHLIALPKLSCFSFKSQTSHYLRRHSLQDGYFQIPIKPCPMLIINLRIYRPIFLVVSSTKVWLGLKNLCQQSMKF